MLVEVFGRDEPTQKKQTRVRELRGCPRRKSGVPCPRSPRRGFEAWCPFSESRRAGGKCRQLVCLGGGSPSFVLMFV